MKKIELNKGALQLPESWDELTYKQRLYAFRLLHDVIGHRLSPETFRIRMLICLTGYKPSHHFFSLSLRYILFFAAVPFVALWCLANHGRIRFPAYWSVWYGRYKPKRYDRDIINYNLYKLSEQLDFAFRIEDRTIQINTFFRSNPFPYIRIGRKKYAGKKFIRDISPFTNITGHEFSDCFDIYSLYSSDTDATVKCRCVDKIISILYPASADYNENMVTERPGIQKLPAGIKTGIMCWFAGIVEYYVTHPYYSILFGSSDSNDSDTKSTIRIGMNETVLMISSQGYNENDTVNNFFDAQLVILKKNLSSALTSGVKIEELAGKTNMSIQNINKLIGK
ncbi:hypothetical protein IR083_10175 [Dysgonomonas sp. GY75]|uniref:hypothetical protein n=1 Tax=Dysgonomonas sp. GY75 TaxID=2780419 RepID=UPI00188450F5|nr:hypothetical protein [Dysgonomonas sp. GY75]MBF0649187.1 hypothetical protein [Dysgonomonas sp. GY75]